MTVVLVLYIATLIGISLELAFFRTRGAVVEKRFESQIEDIMSPIITVSSGTWAVSTARRE